MPRKNRLYFCLNLKERDFELLAKGALRLQRAERFALSHGISVESNIDDYERCLELLIPTERLKEVFKGLHDDEISFGILDIHDTKGLAIAEELEKAYPSICMVDETGDEAEPDAVCSVCGSTSEVESTYCGSLCREHLQEHIESCSICAKDFTPSA